MTASRERRYHGSLGGSGAAVTGSEGGAVIVIGAGLAADGPASQLSLRYHLRTLEQIRHA
jgi:hypothetical protein